jgi:hypothetical protein
MSKQTLEVYTACGQTRPTVTCDAELCAVSDKRGAASCEMFFTLSDHKRRNQELMTQ